MSHFYLLFVCYSLFATRLFLARRPGIFGPSDPALRPLLLELISSVREDDLTASGPAGGIRFPLAVNLLSSGDYILPDRTGPDRTEANLALDYICSSKLLDSGLLGFQISHVKMENVFQAVNTVNPAAGERGWVIVLDRFGFNRRH